MAEPIRLQQEDGIAILTLDRPDVLNAIDRSVLEGLENAFQTLMMDRDLRVVILTGAGRAFAAGADIRAMAPMGPDEALAFARFGSGVMDRIEAFPRPVIAALNGHALGGGCELAMACDLRISAEGARLGQPETTLGVIPGFGGSQRLPRLVGRSRAKRLLFTGEIITAAQALEMGLVDEVVPGEALMERCLTLARTIAQRGPHAVAQCKELVDKGMDLPLWHGLELEAERFGQCFATHDQKEGMKAFLEKRPAAFRGA